MYVCMIGKTLQGVVHDRSSLDKYTSFFFLLSIRKKNNNNIVQYETSIVWLR
jgi:hypothetical protein